MDTSTGTFSGIFDEDLKSCKPFNQIDCPYGTLYNPEESDLTGVREYEREREQLQPKLQPSMIKTIISLTDLYYFLSI